MRAGPRSAACPWRLNGRDLAAAASGFGLGAPWRLPLPSFSGSMRTPSGVAAVAAGTIGEGSVKVSPLAMAMIAAQVATGTWHEPSLVAGPYGATQAPRRATPVQRGRPGHAADAHARPPCTAARPRRPTSAGRQVYGQVGTVSVQTGKHPVWASWFVGYRGDVAIAVLELSHSPTTSAAPLAAQILAAAP